MELDRFQAESIWEKYCKCAEFDSERLEQQLVEQFRPLLRGLAFRLRHGVGWLFPAHDIEDYLVLAELSFVLAVRAMKAEQAAPEQVVGCLRARCLFQMLKLLRSEFEFSSSVVWGQVVRGSSPSSVLEIVRADKLEDLLAPDQSDGDDDESRDELWLSSSHRDLDPQQALELKELAWEIWSGLCSGELRIPERGQHKDELISFLRECGLQVSEADYKRMLRRNKARRLRAQVRMDEESQSQSR